MADLSDTPDLVTLLERSAERYADRVAWTFDLREAGAPVVETVTFAEVAGRSAAYAQALHERGVGAGDRVAVLLGNRPEFGLVWLALIRLGAAMVPLNVRYGPVDAAHLLTDSAAVLVVTAPEHAELIGRTDVEVATVLVDNLSPMGGWQQGPVDPAAVVNVQYTSGTTGRPKGCLLDHHYWLHLTGSMVEEFPHLTDHDVMLTAQPFHYIDPQWNLLTALLAGARLVALDGFHPSTFWERVREHEVTYFYCLASMPTLLHRMPADPLDQVHRVRAIQCSAIPVGLHTELEERWGVPWFEAFGMTETGADIRVGAADHDELVGSGCLGSPAAHREVRVVDGEMWLRGPGMMLGYLGHPSPFVDGWFRTGDLVRLDDRDRVYLVGRLKDMIRRSGENIAAREVEEVLLTHPAVRLAAVIGVPDDIRGEEVKAFVVAPGADESDLTTWCAQRLAGFKVPRFWEFRDDLPLTASHRVEKSKLLP